MTAKELLEKRRPPKAPTAAKKTAAAVLVPLVQQQGEWHLLYIRRSRNERDRHSGQVAFPGGRAEPFDACLSATALREANEEVGLDTSRVQLLGKLPEYVTVSHYQVTPVVGVVDWPQPLTLQTSEVARAFTIPLSWLQQSENYELRDAPRLASAGSAPPPRRSVVYYQRYDGELLWGATARITLNLIKACRSGQMPFLSVA